ncbi:hypothetical protein RBSWK_00878 [Rhodopirellula baltica SWK14]|uniref:Uncharacterized protein n=1 Tax=Rhodopirellula baltica SWK14 TaxID=993516 RepID=L7CMY4_RHOBT|nr:hypothetical protein RBSWK_00878 [Rhodopirellula baltica SWK14]
MTSVVSVRHLFHLSDAVQLQQQIPTDADPHLGRLNLSIHSVLARMLDIHASKRLFHRSFTGKTRSSK